VRFNGFMGLASAFAVVAGPGFAAPPPVADYGKLPAAEQVRLSPDGDKIAYIGFDNGKPLLVVRRVDGPVLMESAPGDQRLRAVNWLDEDHVLAQTTSYTKSLVFADAGALVGVSIIVNVKTGKSRLVFEGHKKIVPTTFGYYGRSRDNEKTYAYFGGLTLVGGGNSFSDFDNNVFRAGHGHTDLYKVDVDTGDVQAVALGQERRSLEWVVDRAGAVTAHTEYDDETADWRLYADPMDTVLIEEAKDPAGDIGLLGVGRTPGSILTQQPAGASGDFTTLEFQPRTGAGGIRPFGDEAMADFISDPATGLLIGGVTNSDKPRTILFDPAQQAKFDKVTHALQGERVTLESATAGLDRMIVRAEGPGDSGTFFFVDVAARKVEAVAWAYPTILQDAVGPVSTITYKAADGLQIEGVLTLPPGRPEKGLPVVVLPHGGPSARDYAHFDWWAQAFASRGYAVFQPNFRGSYGFGKAFRDAGYGQWGRKMQTDVSDGVAELARQGIVDPHRACIVGASYGGYVALAGVTVQQGLYRCAVSVAGVSDLKASLAWRENKYGYNSEVSRYDHLYLGVKSASDSSLDDVSPVHFARRADAPVLLIHGKNDIVVPIDQSLLMRDALTSAGKPVELVELTGEDHWLSKAETRTQMLEASVAFVEKYNPPD
jgi:dipeptidyl aminopeptidase/acylaminoacyl peptidase